MMNTQKAPATLKLKVGLFTLLGILLTIAITVYVNDRPFWWRSCQLVHINVEDATGLKTKSPIRSLGLQIGYLDSVQLYETYVRLGICITAPVDVLPSTRAYIKGEGFLGDKFVELKPVKYVGRRPPGSEEEKEPVAPASPAGKPASARSGAVFIDRTIDRLWSLLVAAPVYADDRSKGKSIPVGQNSQDVQKLVEQVDGLVGEMKSLTTNLREAIDPQEMRKTMQQLNRALENASKTLSPAGGLNKTAQRTLEKLEDGIEQLRDIIARVNKGQGSVGMLLNDPAYAEDIKKAIHSLNTAIDRLSRVRVNVNLGVHQIEQVGGRGWLLLEIWPHSDRYYKLGMTSDPRGALKVVDYTTTVNGTNTTVRTTQLEQGGLVLNAMIGRVFYNRIDLSVGLLHGDGAVSAEFLLGPQGHESLARVRGDIYTRSRGNPVDERTTLVIQPFESRTLLHALYFSAGLESIRKINGNLAWGYGAGITFDDEDLRVLFAFR